MSKKQKVCVFLLMFLILATVAAGLVWHLQTYFMVDFRFYPRQAQSLDLRDQTLTTRQFTRIRRQLPDCDILWNVPFQDSALASDSREIRVTSLSDADLDLIPYFTQLESIQAEGCTDYDQLLTLQEKRPDLALHFDIQLEGTVYERDIDTLTLSAITSGELKLLDCLPQLQTVRVAGGANMENFTRLQAYCHERGLDFRIVMGDQDISDMAETLTATDVTDDELNLLALLPNLKQLHLITPSAAAETVVNIAPLHPTVQVTWEQTICGKLVYSEDVEVDLSDATIKSLEQVEAGMAYFPRADSVFLGLCGLDNEMLAEYRERSRDSYKVVWTVVFGDKLPTRTDAITFYPTGDGVYYFDDEEAYNLRYCEDMVCLDIGHMSVSDVSFLAYMPNLEYLILAHTQVQHLDGIENCKKLKFLEVDWAPIKDYTPLKECTALEDLNIGNTYAKIDPILEMTWLKNLWMVGCKGASPYRATQTLLDTTVYISGNATVSGGWRKLDNYYAMRDLLGAEYMHG